MVESQDPQNRMFTLRPITPDDAETVVRLVMELAGFVGCKEKVSLKAEEIEKYAFGDQPVLHGLIAEEGTNPVGLCLYYPIFSSWWGRPGVFVLDLWVDASCRGHGLGRRLLRQVAAISKRWDGSYIKLNADQDNVSAQDFYTNLGFRYIFHDKPYILDGDAMERLLSPDTQG